MDDETNELEDEGTYSPKQIAEEFSNWMFCCEDLGASNSDFLKEPEKKWKSWVLIRKPNRFEQKVEQTGGSSFGHCKKLIARQQIMIIIWH